MNGVLLSSTRILVTVLALCGWAVTTVTAQPADVRYSLAAGDQYAPGSPFTYLVEVANNPTDIGGFAFRVLYDNAKVSFVGIENVSGGPFSFLLTAADEQGISPANYRNVAGVGSPNPGVGRLILLRFITTGTPPTSPEDPVAVIANPEQPGLFDQGGNLIAHGFSLDTAAKAPDAPSGFTPPDGTVNIPETQMLSWTGGLYTASFEVRLWKSTDPKPVGATALVSDPSYTPMAPLDYTTAYNWEVTAVGLTGLLTAGPTLAFTTRALPAPAKASAPDPADQARNVTIATNLDWADAADVATYNVYWGTNPDVLSLIGNVAASQFDLQSYLGAPLALGITYYWRVDSTNATATTTGNVWRFTTVANIVPVQIEYLLMDGNPYAASSEFTFLVRAANNTYPLGGFAFRVTYDSTQLKLQSIANAPGSSFSWIYDTSAEQGSAPANYRNIGGVETTNPAVGEMFLLTFRTTGTPPVSPAQPFVLDDNTDTPVNLVSDGGLDLFHVFALAPPLPAKAQNPVPAHLALDVPVTTNLGWDVAAGATFYEVFFGTNPAALTSIGAVATNSFDLQAAYPGPLDYGTEYFWRVDSLHISGRRVGNVWKFTSLVSDVPAVIEYFVASGDPTAPNSQFTAVARITNNKPANHVGAFSFRAIFNDAEVNLVGLQPVAGSSFVFTYDLSGLFGSGVGAYRNLGGLGTGNPANGDLVELIFQTTGLPPLGDPFTLSDNMDAGVPLVSEIGLAIPHTFLRTIAPPPGMPSGFNPPDGAVDVAVLPTLSWVGGAYTSSFDVQLAPQASFDPLVTPKYNVTTSQYIPPADLEKGIAYNWRITARGPGGETASAILTFTTFIPLPSAPSGPNPPHMATSVPIAVDLLWAPSADTTSYDVYFGTDPLALVLKGNVPTPVASNALIGGPLALDTLYYWQIVAKGPGGSTPGPVWQFRTTVTITPVEVRYSWATGFQFEANKDFTYLVWVAANDPANGIGGFSFQVIYNGNEMEILEVLPVADSGFNFLYDLSPEAGTAPVNTRNISGVGSGNPANGYLFELRCRTKATPPNICCDPLLLTDNPGQFGANLFRDGDALELPHVFILTKPVPCPDKPTLISPPNGALDVPLSTTFTWKGGLFTTSYNLYLWKDGETSGTPKATNLTSPSYTPPSSLDANANFNWFVQAVGPCCTTASDVWTFVSFNPPPPATVAYYRINGDPTVPNSTFSYVAELEDNPTVEGVGAFTFRVTYDSNKINLVAVRNVFSGMSFTLDLSGVGGSGTATYRNVGGLGLGNPLNAPMFEFEFQTTATPPDAADDTVILGDNPDQAVPLVLENGDPLSHIFVKRSAQLWTPTPTETPTPTVSPSPTDSPSPTPTASPSPSPTTTPTMTMTATPSPSPSYTIPPTPTEWPSPTPPPSPTEWPTFTQAPSPTPFPSASPTTTPTLTPSYTPVPSPTEWPTLPSPTPTETLAPSPSPTETLAPSPSPTETPWPSASPTTTPTLTVTPSPSVTQWPSYTPIPSPTEWPSPTPPPSPTDWPPPATPTPYPTLEPTTTPTLTATFTPTPTPWPTLPTPTPTLTPAPSPSASATPGPSPSPTATPVPTITPRPTFDFVPDEQGWTFHSAPTLDPPDHAAIPGSPGVLRMQAVNNAQCYGYWESPVFQLAGITGRPVPGAIMIQGDNTGETLFVARYKVRSNVVDQTQVPTLRMRTTSISLSKSTMLVAESKGDGAYSPTLTGTNYYMWFVPSPDSLGFQLAYEMLNFDPRDAATGILDLDEVELYQVDPAILSDQKVEKEYTFEADSEGWLPVSVAGFTAPAFEQGDGALKLTSKPGDNVYGYWSLPADGANGVTIEAGRVYIVKFTVASNVDAENAAKVPGLRLRVHENAFRAASMVAVESITGAVSPIVGDPKTYDVYFVPPAEAAGYKLIPAFDITKFNIGDSDTAQLWLTGVVVESAKLH